jgi:lipoyl(octanoyl) transferase
VVYPLIHFKRLKIGVRDLVCRLENAIILTLAEYGIVGVGDRDAPGVYVAGKKIASLGLRIKNGCVYHGLSLNVAMDLRPYAHINPCGYAGLDVTDLRSEIQGSPNPDVPEMTVAEVAERLMPHLLAQLYAEKTA